MTCPYSSLTRSLSGHVEDIVQKSSEEPEGSAAPMVSSKRSDERAGAVYYHDYLAIESILSSHKPVSEPVMHDEHLFITIHRAYEIWFHQIIIEMDSIIAIFNSNQVDEKFMLTIVNRLERVNEIWKLLNSQIKILETMTPMDFMEFRTALSPASGFQSVQFRLIENKMGLKKNDRSNYQRMVYDGYFTHEHAKLLADSETQNSLLEVVKIWLERTPGVNSTFWQDYCGAVSEMLQEDKREIEQATLNDTQRETMYKECTRNELSFATFTDKTQHDALVGKKERRLSHKAMIGALLIFLYRDEPKFQIPFKLLSRLIELDTLVAQWRFSHINLVHQIIGIKGGTGGSSGFFYLKTTLSDKYRVFIDLCNISTWIIPKKRLPTLPCDLLKNLRYAENKN